MDKGIGFNRNVLLRWMDAAACFRSRTESISEIREGLNDILRQDIASDVNRRKAIDILINIWASSADDTAKLNTEAVAYLKEPYGWDSSLWLHYGLVLVAYPFFREAAAHIGQMVRQGHPITTAMVKQRLISSRGLLGSLANATERVIFSLRDWGVLANAEERYHYTASQPHVTTSSQIELWLLACALRAHPATEISFLDLVRLPELFGFRITVGLDALRRCSYFTVERQGGEWHSVRLAT